jgi:hypothetical protein
MRASSAVSAASIAPFCPVARAFSRSASAAAIFCFSCSCDTATCPACARMHSYVRARMWLCARTRFVSRVALRHAAHVRCATCSSSSFSFAAASFVSACHAAWDTYHAGRDRATSGSCLPRPRPSYRPPASPSAASAPSAPPPRWPAPPPPRRFPRNSTHECSAVSRKSPYYRPGLPLRLPQCAETIAAFRERTSPITHRSIPNVAEAAALSAVRFTV